MNRYDISHAYLVVNSVDIYPFKRLCASEALGITLPCQLKPHDATLKEMLNRVEHEDIDVFNLVTDHCGQYQATANRLKVFEQMMKNSDLCTVKHEDFTFDSTKIPQADEDGMSIIPLTQNRLSEVQGKIIEGQKYYPAEAIEQLCANTDKEFSKLSAKYEELWRKVDPKFIETHCRMMQLSKDLSTSCLETLNTLIDKLTEALKTK